MADDKTAAGLRDRIASRLELGWRASADYTPDEVLLRQAWQALVVDRVTVAPDRETLARTIFEAQNGRVIDDEAWRRRVALDTPFVRHAFAAADAVLASGVLGVPADQVRAEGWDMGITSARGALLNRSGTYEADIDILSLTNPYRKSAGA